MISLQQFAYNNRRTEATIAEVHAGTAQDVDTAVKAAKAALVHPSWKLLPGTERGILMGKLADLIEANKEVLASIEAWDNGMHSLSHLYQAQLTAVFQANHTLWH
jgi:acyl-CoA reductase-like NAD-dependent aldehyde dehydrogenase